MVADTETYNILIGACKQKGMLEKALEVFTWMQVRFFSAKLKAKVADRFH